jgi:hypothetical protein
LTRWLRAHDVEHDDRDRHLRGEVLASRRLREQLIGARLEDHPRQKRCGERSKNPADALALRAARHAEAADEAGDDERRKQRPGYAHDELEAPGERGVRHLIQPIRRRR